MVNPLLWTIVTIRVSVCKSFVLRILQTNVLNAAMALAAVATLGFTPSAFAANSIRISQVFGGGGKANAPYNADFVELFNNSDAPINIGGWVISYSSATGTYGASQISIPAGTIIEAKSYFLVQTNAPSATVGASMRADLYSPTSIDLNTSAGNVALLTAAQSGTTNTCASLNSILVDKVGYGTGNCSEASATAAPSDTTAVIRKGSGATDSDNNANDFFVATPQVRNSLTRYSLLATASSTPAADGWTIATTGTASSGVASSDAGSVSWRLTASAGSSNSISATRAVSAGNGRTVGLQFDNNATAAPASGTSTGIQFYSGTNVAFTFQLVNGTSFYKIVDNSGTVNTTLAPVSTGVDVALEIRPSGAYSFTANGYTHTGTLASSATAITSVRVYNIGLGSTLVNFNDLRVSTAVWSASPFSATTTIPDASPEVYCTAMTIGTVYSIYSLGTTTAAQWNAGGVIGTAESGSVFTATATTTGGGNGKVNAIGVVSKTFVVPAGQFSAGIDKIRVKLVGLTHTYSGDLSCTLISPNGAKTATLFRRTGLSNTVPYGEESDFGGTYEFSDSFSSNLWTAAAVVDATTAIPSSGYHPSTTAGANSNLTSIFAGAVTAGTWTLKLTDSVDVDIGTISSAVVEFLSVIDSDGDGTGDSNDGCPNDPNKIAPGQCGCGVADTDSDGDGTANCNDLCPSDPLKIAAGTCGCGVADTDSDGDGTANCNDGCPADANKTAPGTCGCGVADTDTDADGTADCNDLCPSDPLKIAAGTCGCGVADTDTDADGTADCNDGCPADANKTAPGTCGCGVADTDTDADGTADCNDLCPSDPLKIAAGTCGCGVADTDSDGDGAADCNDGCPADANKTAPGTCGCGVADTDSDGDGAADCNDGCPADANKTAPGICGCGVADTDSDGDGTADCNDLCPSDPLKIAAGTCGCGVADTDSDGDGTANCNDGCPTDANKIAPGICGCGVADTDSDGDGTANCNDGCPTDANKIAPGICGCGVADTDSDGDTIVDCNDNCPAISNPSQVDCNGNGIGDTCDIASGQAFDCNQNNIPDPCDIASGASIDIDSNGVPDECKNDCNGNSIPDPYEIAQGLEFDCNLNGVLDSCDIASGFAADCNGNTIPDSCDISGGAETDCDGNGTPDSCQADCNNDGIPNICEITAGAADIDGDGTPDSCECANADLTLDGIVGGDDLAIFLANWGSSTYPCGDFDNNGSIGGGDLSILLAKWGIVH